MGHPSEYMSWSQPLFRSSGSRRIGYRSKRARPLPGVWERGSRAMHVQVLGQLEVIVRGKSILPSAGKTRQVLALLALNPGRIVTVGALMEELWGSAIPRSAATTLQTYVMQVRRKLRTALAGDPARTPMDVLITH